MLVCVFYLHFARETAGAARTRLSLRPLLSRRVKDDANLGRIAPRDREAVFEIAPTLSSLRKQGPITTGLPCCAKAVDQHLSKQPPRRMGPCFRRDDSVSWLRLRFARNDGL